ncbi:hypothetical protein AB1Y20_023334 [Prymnesium parvum]|uniref:Ubiquitin-conjugating enzyme E2C-binding protein n=1 Tax=Prymnesium parvum TaxID=97485 RepID=A0AB34JEC2_PRYPA
MFGSCRCRACVFPPPKRLRLHALPSPPPPPPPASPLAPPPPCKEPPPVFVLERLAHIRCFSLVVCAPAGATLRDVSLAARGSLIDLRCVHSRLAPPAAACLRLDVGEEVEAAALRLPLSGSHAHARLPLRGASSRHAPAHDASHLRDEAGLACRAAAQRAAERAALRGGGALRCAACGGALCDLRGDVRPMPDADAAAMVDFVQCCDDLSFGWECIFPPPDDAPPPPPVGFFMGSHALLLDAPAPPSLRACAAEAFLEPRTYRHAFRGAAPAARPAVWEPLRCARCASLVGAARRAAGAPAVETAPPAWFEERSPAELHCTLQLLKARVRVDRAAAAEGEQVFAGYSMSRLVAARVARMEEEAGEDEEAEGAASAAEDPRRVVLGPQRDAPCLALALINSYVTLHTNHEWGAAATGRAFGSETVECTVDALKVFFTRDADAIARMAPDEVSRPSWLCLAADECELVAKELELSSQMLPPEARMVGKLHVGYLAVAPTWD